MLQLGYNSRVFTATTTGTLVAAQGGGATALNVPAMEGRLGGVVLYDTGASEVQIYDGTSTSGKLIFQGALPSGGGLVPILFWDLQITTGLYIVVSGGSGSQVTTVFWK